MKDNELWVIEARFNKGMKSKGWSPACFFKMADFRMSYTSDNLREAGKMKRDILKAFFGNWKAADLRISLYKLDKEYRRNDARARSQ